MTTLTPDIIDVGTSIRIGGVERLSSSGDVLTELITGPDDGTGIVIGHASTGASTGSVAQLVTMTDAQRDDLVATNGMLFYNSTAAGLQARMGGVWVNIGSGHNFGDTANLDALVFEVASTSGVRLDLESGALAVREGDDTGYAGLLVKTLTVEDNIVYTGGGVVERIDVGTGLINFGATGIRANAGTPEGAMVGPVGSLHLRSDGGSGTTLYTKVSGATATGWETVGGPMQSSYDRGSTITGSVALDIDTTAAISIDSTATIAIGGDPDTGAIHIGTAGARSIAIGNASATTMSLTSAGGFSADAVSGFSIDSTNGTASNITNANTTASTNTLLTIESNNTGATAGDATLALDTNSTNGTASILIGTVNADAINIGTNVVLASGQDSAFTFTDGTIQASGSVAIHSSTTSALILDSGTTGAISIGVDGTNAKTLNLDSGTTGDLNVGTSAFAKAVTVGNTTAGTTLALKAEGYQTINGKVALTDNTAVTVLTVALATGESSGGAMRYTVYADDATDFQTYTRNLTWSAVNKAGTITVDVDNGTPTSQALSSGTLSVGVSATTGASLFNIQINADSSLTVTTLDMVFVAEEFGSQALTVA